MCEVTVTAASTQFRQKPCPPICRRAIPLFLPRIRHAHMTKTTHNNRTNNKRIPPILNSIRTFWPKFMPMSMPYKINSISTSIAFDYATSWAASVLSSGWPARLTDITTEGYCGIKHNRVNNCDYRRFLIYERHVITFNSRRLTAAGGISRVFQR